MKSTMCIELGVISVLVVLGQLIMIAEYVPFTWREHIVLDAKSLISMMVLVHTPGLKLDIHGEDAGTVLNMLRQEGFCEIH